MVSTGACNPYSKCDNPKYQASAIVPTLHTQKEKEWQKKNGELVKENIAQWLCINWIKTVSKPQG